MAVAPWSRMPAAERRSDRARRGRRQREPSRRPAPSTPAGAAPATLTGRAVLPASTFASGPPSGAHIAPPFAAGVHVSFPSQPVQGFSAFLPARGGDLLALADNGYGALENSADFQLRIYRIHPDYRRGTVAVK